MICSSCTVGVLVAKACWMDLTRHTVPAPGSRSSCIQLPIPIPSVLSGVSVAVASRSLICSGILTAGTIKAAVRLCPFKRIIYTYLPQQLTDHVTFSADTVIAFAPGLTYRSSALPPVRLSITLTK